MSEINWKELFAKRLYIQYGEAAGERLALVIDQPETASSPGYSSAEEAFIQHKEMMLPDSIMPSLGDHRDFLDGFQIGFAKYYLKQMDLLLNRMDRDNVQSMKVELMNFYIRWKSV